MGTVLSGHHTKHIIYASHAHAITAK